MSFLGKQSSFSNEDRSSNYDRSYERRHDGGFDRSNNRSYSGNRGYQSNDNSNHVATTESLRTVFLSHLPPSYTNINSVSEAQKKVEDLVAKYIGPNNVQRVKILGEGRVKIVFKMAIWAKQILKELNNAVLHNDDEWLQRQERLADKERKEHDNYEEERDLDRNYEGNDFNIAVQSIVPLGKDHFGKKVDENKKMVVKKASQSDLDSLRKAEYRVRVIDHEEKLENAQKLASRSRDVVVKGIPKTLTLKEAEKKLSTWLGSIGVITNIRIPAKYNSVQDHNGYAFVSFNRPKHAEMAIEKKNGRMFEGVKLIIEEKMNRDDYLKKKEEEEATNPQFHVDVTEEDIQKRKNDEKMRKLEEKREEKERLEREKLERLNKWKAASSGTSAKAEETKEKGSSNQTTDSMVDESSSDEDSMSIESEEASIQGFDSDSEEEEEDTKKPLLIKKEVTEKKEEKKEMTKQEEELTRTIFVKNIPVGATEDDVVLLFSTYGRVAYAKLVINKKTNAPSGTAFVMFRDREGYSKLFQASRLANILNNVERKSDIKEKAREFKKSIAHLPEKQQKRRMREFYHDQKNATNSATVQTNFFTVDTLTLQSSQIYFAKAMSKDSAKEKVIAKELEKARDKRKLYLASEGYIPKNSPAAVGLPESFLKKLEEKYVEKQQRLKSNPALHVNDRRLKVSYIPKTWDHKKFKDVVITHVKKATGKVPKMSQVIILKDEKGRSKGMGFLEFDTHDMALAALRELNNNPNVYKEGRLYMEFAIDDLVKIHKMKYKSASVSYDTGPVSKSRINRIVNKLEDKETMNRIERIMGDTAKPFQYKRKRDDGEPERNNKRRRKSE